MFHVISLNVNQVSSNISLNNVNKDKLIKQTVNVQYFCDEEQVLHCEFLKPVDF